MVIHLCTAFGCFIAITTELNSCDRDFMPTNSKIFPIPFYGSYEYFTKYHIKDIIVTSILIQELINHEWPTPFRVLSNLLSCVANYFQAQMSNKFCIKCSKEE